MRPIGGPRCYQLWYFLVIFGLGWTLDWGPLAAIPFGGGAIGKYIRFSNDLVSIEGNHTLLLWLLLPTYQKSAKVQTGSSAHVSLLAPCLTRG